MNYVIPALLCLAAALPALDTPLILTPEGTPNLSTDQLLEISPNIGVMSYYQATLQNLQLQVGHNFLADLDFLDKRLMEIRNGAPYTTLRVGAPTMKPTAQEFLDQFSDDHKDADTPSLREAATAAENAFWSKPHDFDGVVRAAWNDEFAVLVIPSKHTILVYSTSTQSIDMVAYLNYGPFLLVQSSFNSNPTPQVVFQKLPQLEQDKLLAAQKKKNDEDNGKTKETPKSDAWVCAGQGDVFFVCDTANNVVFSFVVSIRDVRLISVRNMSCELALPSGANYQSDPEGNDTLATYLQKNQRALSSAGLVFKNLYEVKAYLKANSHGKSSATGLQANALQDKAILDFTDKHKMLTYSLSSSSLDLIAARDYSMDEAVMVLDAAISNKGAAPEIYTHAKSGLQDHTFALNQLKFALSLDPTLVTKLEKDSRIASALKGEAGWGPLLDQGHRDLDAQKAMWQQVQDDAKAMQEEDEKALKDAQDPGKSGQNGGGGDTGGGGDNGSR